MIIMSIIAHTLSSQAERMPLSHVILHPPMHTEMYGHSSVSPSSRLYILDLKSINITNDIPIVYVCRSLRADAHTWTKTYLWFPYCIVSSSRTNIN
jgi:hypothetical protein